MKKIFLALSIMLTVAVSTTFANPVISENPQAEKTFNKEFAGAENIQWSKTRDGVLKVTFTWGGTRAEAYFDTEAELIATIRNIFYSQVPLNVMRSVNARFENPIVLGVNEISTTSGSRYLISLENNGKKYSATISSLGEISDVKKEKK